MVSDAERELDQLLDRTEGDARIAIRDEMATTMHENSPASSVASDQMRRRGEIIDSFGSATAASSSRTKGRSSTTTHAGARARLPARAGRLHGRAGLARRRVAGRTPALTTTRTATTITPLSIRQVLGERPTATRLGVGPHDQMAARGKEVLVSRITALLVTVALSRSGSPVVGPRTCPRRCLRRRRRKLRPRPPTRAAHASPSRGP